MWFTLNINDAGGGREVTSRLARGGHLEGGFRSRWSCVGVSWKLPFHPEVALGQLEICLKPLLMLFRGYVQVCLEVSLRFMFGSAGAHLEISRRLAWTLKQVWGRGHRGVRLEGSWRSPGGQPAPCPTQWTLNWTCLMSLWNNFQTCSEHLWGTVLFVAQPWSVTNLRKSVLASVACTFEKRNKNLPRVWFAHRSRSVTCHVSRVLKLWPF